MSKEIEYPAWAMRLQECEAEVGLGVLVMGGEHRYTKYTIGDVKILISTSDKKNLAAQLAVLCKRFIEGTGDSVATNEV